MCKFALFLLSLCLWTTSQAREPLPQRQKRMSIHYLQSTATGQALIRQSTGSTDSLFAIYRFGDMPENTLRLYHITQSHEGVEIRINADLLASSYEYMSWTLAQALVGYQKFRIETKYSVYLPEFIELSYWAHSVAMRHWRELGLPNQHDYAKHPQADIAAVAHRLQASTSQISQWYLGPRSDFLSYLRSRHLRLGYDAVFIEDFLRSSTGRHREAALELQSLLEY